MPYYVDTSALVKLVVAEPSTPELQAWLDASLSELVASDLVRTELMRTVRRAAPSHVGRARQVLDSVILVEVPPGLFETAGRLEPASLRSLDALHLASALEIGDDLEGMITYDVRLAEAAASHGIPVIAP